jgi:hypothetical protein
MHNFAASQEGLSSLKLIRFVERLKFIATNNRNSLTNLRYINHYN